MAPKVPKKDLKPIEKPLNKPIMKSKKMKKKNYQNFSSFLFKLLRLVAKNGSNIGISRQSMQIMNNFVNDMLEKVAWEAGKLVLHGKNQTMGSREIQSAVRLLLPKELAKHANIEGMKALSKYYRNTEKTVKNNKEKA